MSLPPTDASAALKAKEAKKSESPEKEQNLRAVVARKVHRPLRSREEEKAAYGRVFIGCGLQSDYEVTTKLGEGTFGYVSCLFAQTRSLTRHVVKCTKRSTPRPTGLSRSNAS